MGSHKNTNAISTKHISSPTSDKCLRQITLKCRRLQTIVTVTVTTQPYHTVFHFRHSFLIITLYCTCEVDSRCFTLYQAAVLYTKTALDISNFSSIFPMQPLTGQTVTLRNVFTLKKSRRSAPSTYLVWHHKMIGQYPQNIFRYDVLMYWWDIVVLGAHL